jgi:hypothetical protein
LYCLILAVLTVPWIVLTLGPQVTLQNAAESYLQWQYWLCLLVMTLSQVALLSVPVRLANRRPITRGALWPTVLAGGLMAGGLVAAAGYSVVELLTRLESVKGPQVLLPIAFGVVVWGLWSVLFARSFAKTEPADWISAQCRWLLRGSILELLIAVPTHIVARARGYCCAGLLTFIGLTMGISVMLFSFGPAVLFLYAERWRRLRAKAPIL